MQSVVFGRGAATEGTVGGTTGVITWRTTFGEVVLGIVFFGNAFADGEAVAVDVAIAGFWSEESARGEVFMENHVNGFHHDAAASDGMKRTSRKTEKYFFMM